MLSGPEHCLALLPTSQAFKNNDNHINQFLAVGVPRAVWTPFCFLLSQIPIVYGIESPACSCIPSPTSWLHCYFSATHHTLLSVSIPALAICWEVASIWVWQVNRGLSANGQNETAKLTFDSLLASHGQRQGMCWVDDMGPQCLSWLLGMLIKFRHTGTMDRDLTKLSCEIWRALAFVPWTTLATIHARKMANHWNRTEKMWRVG